MSNYVTTQDLNTALADYVTSTAFTQALASKQDTISDLAAIRAGANAGASALQSGDNVSELNNDAGYLTTAPVTSVN